MDGNIGDLITSNFSNKILEIPSVESIVAKVRGNFRACWQCRSKQILVAIDAESAIRQIDKLVCC